jgi:hypothetical protein
VQSQISPSQRKTSQRKRTSLLEVLDTKVMHPIWLGSKGSPWKVFSESWLEALTSLPFVCYAFEEYMSPFTILSSYLLQYPCGPPYSSQNLAARHLSTSRGSLLLLLLFHTMDGLQSFSCHFLNKQNFLCYCPKNENHDLY